jgi:DNA-binding GntR family transcriptional regulator
MIITRPGDERDYPESHRELLEILRQRDPEKAMEAIRDHTLLTAQRAIERSVV